MPPDRPPGLYPRLTGLALLGTAAMAAFLVLRRTEVSLAVHLYAVWMGSLAGAAMAVRALAGTRVAEQPSRLFGRRGKRRRAESLRALEELEHAVDFATATAFDVQFRLRPHLVRIARHRLSATHGVLLEADPVAASRLLGEAAWELVRPDREPPAQRNARGISLARVRAAVDALEAL